MGTFNCKMRLDSMDGERSVEIDALVDTGATLTVVPAGILRRLGVSPTRPWQVTMADGHTAEWDAGEARATIHDRSVPTLVLFGEDGTDALLGAYTLEGLHLAVDPYEQRLIPMPPIRARPL